MAEGTGGSQVNGSWGQLRPSANGTRTSYCPSLPGSESHRIVVVILALSPTITVGVFAFWGVDLRGSVVGADEAVPL